MTHESSKSRLCLTVCLGPQCSVFGGRDILEWAKGLQAAGLDLQLEEVHCTDHCSEAPVVIWNDQYLTQVDVDQLTQRVIEGNWLV